jgi:hypothetical protein
LNKRFGDESAAIEQIADVRRHGDLARVALALVQPGTIGLRRSLSMAAAGIPWTVRRLAFVLN